MNHGGFTPGFRFKEGKLCIFREQEVTVINAWPELTAVTKTVTAGSWQEYWPAFRLIHPYRRAKPKPEKKKKEDPQELLFPVEEVVEKRPNSAPAPDPVAERKRAFDSFRFSFPSKIASGVEHFPLEQWSILQLIKGDPEAIDIVAHCPALAFLVAQQHIARIKGRTPPPRISHLKQRVLAEQFGFPATDGAVNILKKVPAESLSLRRLGRLRVALGEPEILKTLSHLEVVNAGVIELTGDPEIWRQSSPRLLREVSGRGTEKYRADTAETLHQVFVMRQTVEPGRTTAFESRDQLLRMHDKLAVEYCRRAPDTIKACVFPRPPLPGLANCIVPLRTPADLAEEGRLQCNCVASYAKRVECGDVFIYRMLFPERATLSVVRTESGAWERGELQAARNTPVSAAAERAVEAWLAQCAPLI